nr:hypothetical protein [Tatlockia sp.]
LVKSSSRASSPVSNKQIRGVLMGHPYYESLREWDDNNKKAKEAKKREKDNNKIAEEAEKNEIAITSCDVVNISSSLRFFSSSSSPLSNHHDEHKNSSIDYSPGFGTSDE